MRKFAPTENVVTWLSGARRRNLHKVVRSISMKLCLAFSGGLISSRNRGAKFGKKALAKFTRVLKCLDFLRTALDTGKKLASNYGGVAGLVSRDACALF